MSALRAVWNVSGTIFNGIKSGLYVVHPIYAALAAGGFTYLILTCGCSR